MGQKQVKNKWKWKMSQKLINFNRPRTRIHKLIHPVSQFQLEISRLVHISANIWIIWPIPNILAIQFIYICRYLFMPIQSADSSHLMCRSIQNWLISLYWMIWPVQGRFRAFWRSNLFASVDMYSCRSNRPIQTTQCADPSKIDYFSYTDWFNWFKADSKHSGCPIYLDL